MGRAKVLQDQNEIGPRLYRRTTETLYLTSQDPDAPKGTEPYATVMLGRPPKTVEDRVLQTVSFERTLQPSETTAFITGLKRVFSLVDAPSGYVHVTTDSMLAASEVGFQAMAPLFPLPPSRADGTVDSAAAREWLARKHAESTNDRVQKLAYVHELVGPRLRGTYWGTFLGREMVAELGGAERITREAPVHLVAPFGDGALYLQLTPSPETITTPAMQTGLLALEQFLRPVLVPLPLYWATRAAEA
ncbi:type VI immunity family protein [Gemmatimonas sp.]|uniref:type VI immunity family protein n=1 Tax=Gemmatimonas sp. TaxID=1962908 RepID=UPI003DA60F2B